MIFIKPDSYTKTQTLDIKDLLGPNAARPNAARHNSPGHNPAYWFATSKIWLSSKC